MTYKLPTGAPLMVSVSGCRGIVGESLTPETVTRFIAAAVNRVRFQRRAESPRVVVARDGRAGGQTLGVLACGVLSAAGCRVTDLGIATTPTVGVMVRALKADAGLVITASHNPSAWNGMKVITSEGGAPSPEEARRLVAEFESAGAAPWRAYDALGEIARDETSARVHVDGVLGALARLMPLNEVRRRGFRVVLDSVNASGVQAGRMLLEELGCRLIHLNAGRSGVFPHPPEPTREHLVELCAQVTRHGADIGFAQDPDADRLAMVDEKGNYIGEEYTLALGVKSWLSMQPAEEARGAVVAANLSTSRMIDDVAAPFGARVVRTAVGEANVVAGMNQAGARLGGEGNGGLIWSEVVPIRDSLGAMALTLGLLARSGETLSAAVAGVPSYAIVKRKLDLRAGLSQRVVSAARSHFAAMGASMDECDGVRADFAAPSGTGRAWAHVRASNTEPIIRLIAEAPTSRDAEMILDEISVLASRA